ncbi:hypothetical protein [Calothrix sp. PCC 7507]|uniref:hypothetical protein n=1 Tax=Calothrix sp. PCC 7507 TaxID=99598 RepID=UPI00029EEBAA|nr:hypothetical protein [Calothrix sp. PCC 7507]AFY35832.1 hypothetical protein Cal7507_5501 [Calothrix sp. PCC 7507]
MFLLTTINAFGILWAAFLWGIAGVCAGLLVALPVFIIVLSIQNDNGDTAYRVTAFVVAGVVLMGILFGGMFEFEKQLKEQEKSSYLPTQISFFISLN